MRYRRVIMKNIIKHVLKFRLNAIDLKVPPTHRDLERSIEICASTSYDIMELSVNHITSTKQNSQSRNDLCG